MNPQPPRRRPRTLALELVEAIGQRIRERRLGVGDRLPTESALMAEFCVSRTVVREAISKLQAAGLVETRHGIGSFVNELADEPRQMLAGRAQLGTLREVIALLELRIGIETEAAALAALRREEANLAVMREALAAFEAAAAAGGDAVEPDHRFHAEIARATQNTNFALLMRELGSTMIPRARLDGGAPADGARREYLERVNSEHESIYDAIAARDPDGARAAMRTHLANSRERRRRAAALAEREGR